MIGCIILANPFFFTEEQWIPVPQDWNPNWVQGKTYDDEISTGASLLAQIQERIRATERISASKNKQASLAAEESSYYGSEYLTRARLGQGAFRILVTEAYKRKCAITGEKTLPVLESAHINPYVKSGPHSINNGLLLRSDLHKLFDLGYLTITDTLCVEVSKRIKEEYENGRTYYELHGNKLKSIPSEPMNQPARKFIEWHNQNIYVS
jgi:putative restriction endonuclease